ncbi:MAG: response regulator [Thermoanaerobaculaceae bacterium]
MTRRCVLFIDDEEGLLELYRTAFTRLEYDVATAASIESGRARIREGGVDAVVLDIRLGDASGLQLLREVKAAHPRLPIVLCTAYARYQDDFSSWLADAYVVKSSDLGELKLALKRCLEATA